jgi:hypothetical protein
MNISTESNRLTRRSALMGALKGAVAAAAVCPLIAEAAPPAPRSAEPEFVPENDYPFFGGELPAAYALEDSAGRAHPRERTPS